MTYRMYLYMGCNIEVHDMCAGKRREMVSLRCGDCLVGPGG